MPTYEYRRPDGTTFEIVQSMSAPALATDPDTGVPVERVFHAPAVHFKGKGFYNTDYGTKRRQREMESSAKEGADKNDAKVKDKADAKSSSSSETSPPAKSSDGGSGSSSSKAKDAKPAAASKKD
jgi:putative FmdB family regulatory protein